GAAEVLADEVAARLAGSIRDLHAARVVEENAEKVLLRHSRLQDERRPCQAEQNQSQDSETQAGQDQSVAAIAAARSEVGEHRVRTNGTCEQQCRKRQARYAEHQLTLLEHERPEFEQELEGSLDHPSDSSLARPRFRTPIENLSVVSRLARPNLYHSPATRGLAVQARLAQSETDSTSPDGRMTRAMSDFRRDLGLFDAAVVVAGGIVGVGIFANPSNVARVLGSPALILLAWTLGGLVALVGGFVWAELASRFPEVGGQYVYLARAYHPVIGFLYGVALLFIINGGSLAAVSILFASYVDRSFFPLGHAGIRVAAATALVTLTAINALGVRAGKWTNNILMAAKVAGIVALIALAFGGGHTP